jgi:hypothetical protein
MRLVNVIDKFGLAQARCRKGDAEANTIALCLKWLLGIALQDL